jgi:transcriptional regulator of acetoin/glycerol metabolism
VLERAALLADDHRIEPSHLGLEWASATSGGARSQTLDEVCRHHIEAVLRAEHGHVERSARRLGLSRSGLYKKMRRLGLDASTS